MVETRSARGARREVTVAVVLALVVAGLVVPLVVAAHFDAIGVPRGDDWSYLLTLFRFADQGTLDFNNWVSMTLIGQVLIATPLYWVVGRSVGAMQVLTTLLGVGGLLATYGFARRILGRDTWGGAVALVVALGPPWAVLATTFMTDVPVFAFTMVAALLAVVALRHERVTLPYSIGAVAAGLVALSIRQYAAVIVVAVLGALLLRARIAEDRRATRTLVVVAVVALVAGVAFTVWWQHVPGTKQLVPELPSVHTAKTAWIKGAGFLRLAGLVLSPLVLLAGPVAIVRRAWRSSAATTLLVAAGAFVWLASTAWRYRSSQFVGNYVTSDGALSNAVLGGRRPQLFPTAGWALLVLVGSAAGLLLAVAAVPAVVAAARHLRSRRLRSVDPVSALLGLTIVGYSGIYGAAMLAGLPVYDRYFLPVLPFAAVALLRAPARELAEVEATRTSRRARAAWCGVAMALLAAVGLSYAIDSASFDGARWGLARDGVALGWGGRQVNGGFEWVNWHRGQKGIRPLRQWVIRQTPAGPVRVARYCLNVRVLPAGAPLGTRVVASRAYVAPTRRTVRIVLLRSSRPCLKLGEIRDRGRRGAGSRVRSRPPQAPSASGAGPVDTDRTSLTTTEPSRTP